LARSRAAGPGALALAPWLIYLRFIVGDELANADVFFAYRPAHAWLAEGLRQGRVPLWTQHVLGGFPLAFSEYGWFSPLNWLALALLGGHAGFYAAVALYVSLAALSAYVLARAWGASAVGALLAGAVFGLSPFVVAGAALLNQGAAYWVLPAALWCVQECFAGRRLAAPLLAMVLALALLGSHPQLVVIALAPPALYAAALAVRQRAWKQAVLLGSAAAVAAACAAVRFLPTLPLLEVSERSGGLTTAASAIGSVAPHNLLAGLLLPHLEVPRVGASQWTAYVGVLPLALAGYAAAGAFGGAGRTGPGSVAAAAQRARQRWLALLALAGVVLALGAYTPVFWALQRTPLLVYFREPSRFLFWTALAAGLLAAAGYDRLGASIASATAAPGRRAGLVRLNRPLALCLGLFAAFGALAFALQVVEPRAVERLYLQAVGQVRVRDYPPEHYAALARRAWRTLVRSANPLEPGLFVPLAGLTLAVWWWTQARHASWSGPAAVAVVTLPLVGYDLVRLPAIPRRFVDEPAAVAPGGAAGGRSGAAADNAGDGRLLPGEPLGPRTLSWLPLAADFEQRVQHEAAGRDAGVASYRLLKRLLAPNFGLQLDTAQIDGYENLMTREQALLTGALGSERTAAASDLVLSRRGLAERSRLIGERWDLLAAAGVGTVLSVERLQPATWPMSVRYEPRAVRADAGVAAVNAFVVTRPAPRAYVATTWTVAASADAAVRTLIEAGGESGGPQTVVLAGPDTPQPPGGAGLPAEAQLAPSATIRRYGERLVEVEVETQVGALLVLLDANAPGWTASVTGSPAPVLTANVAFRAVAVPAGRHLVRFEYTPPHWHAGVATSAVAGLALGAWLAGSAWSATRRPRAPSS
jgi:hypothetical protein